MKNYYDYFMEKLEDFLNDCEEFDESILLYEIPEILQGYSNIFNSTRIKYPNDYETIFNVILEIIDMEIDIEEVYGCMCWSIDDRYDYLCWYFAIINMLNTYAPTTPSVNINLMLGKLYCFANTFIATGYLKNVETKKGLFNVKRDIDEFIMTYHSISDVAIGFVSDTVDHLYTVAIDAIYNNDLIMQDVYLIEGTLEFIKIINKLNAGGKYHDFV